MEAFAFPEGQLYLWTGSATASALVAYARSIQLQLRLGFSNRPTLAGYYDHLTGQRADLTIETVYSPSLTLQKLFESATAVHAHLSHAHVGGSAGVYLHSGRLADVTINSQENGVLKFSLAYYANRWSAYG